MKATYLELTAPGRLRCRNILLTGARLKGPQLLAKTVYTVISPGTELAAWKGLSPLRPGRTYPRLLGYCNLAEIKKTGPGVSAVKAGDYILTFQSHRSAFICAETEVLYSVARDSGTNLRALSALYLYHLALSALRAGDFQPGHEVAIVGGGTLGCAVSDLARAWGSMPLVFTNQEMSPLPRGAEQILPKVPPSGEFWRDRSGLDGADIAILSSNSWADYQLALEIVRKGGQVVCLGFPGRGEKAPEFNPLDSRFLYDKQLTIRHCGHVPDLEAAPLDIRFTLKRNLRYLASLLQTGAINPEALLSFEVSAMHTQEAYRRLTNRRAGTRTAVISWRR
ncbi:MAG TPA: hypothetical protein VHC86_06650 [Opitutaceae bacterium]|nr:hypothetical protein [Opitutaceae bacterium]